MPDPVELLERLQGHCFVAPPTMEELAARAARRRAASIALPSPSRTGPSAWTPTS